ncbi:MAG: oligosaccharide flippase family protein [Actinomycetes bacterium]
MEVEPAPATGTRARRLTQTFGANAAAALLSLVNVTVVARALGAAGRGEVALAVTIATVVGVVAGLSVQEAAARAVALGMHPASAVASASLALAAATGGVGGMALLFAAMELPNAFPSEPTGVIVLVAASLPVQLGRVSLMYISQAVGDFASGNIAWLLGPLTALTINSTLTVAGIVSPALCVAAWLSGQLAGVAVLILRIVRAQGLTRPTIPLVTGLIRYAAQTHLGRFLEMGNYRLDQWLLGVFRGPRELGYYSVAVAWAEFLYYIPGVIALVFRPELVRGEDASAARRLEEALRLGLLGAGAGGVALAIFSPLLTTSLFGQEFAAASAQLRILTVAAIGITLTQLASTALVARGFPSCIALISGSGLAATLTLNVVLIPPLAGVGAAISTVLAYTLASVVALALLRRRLSVRARHLVPRLGQAIDVSRSLLTSGRRP